MTPTRELKSRPVTRPHRSWPVPRRVQAVSWDDRARGPRSRFRWGLLRRPARVLRDEPLRARTGVAGRADARARSVRGLPRAPPGHPERLGDAGAGAGHRAERAARGDPPGL